MKKEEKLYQVKVKYVGHSGNTYNEELNFTKEQEAIKAYEIFANNVDGFVKEVSFTTIAK